MSQSKSSAEKDKSKKLPKENKSTGEMPVTEGKNVTIRDQPKEDERSYPAPEKEDTRMKNQDEYRK